MVPMSPQVGMVEEGFRGNPGLVPRARASGSGFLLPSPWRARRFSHGKGQGMGVARARCAGLDISEKDARVCVRIAGAGRRKATGTVTAWGSMTGQILALRDHLIARQVTWVVPEAAGGYRKPFCCLLGDIPGAEIMLVSARHVKNLPGRKTSPAPPGWRGPAPVAWCAAPSSRPGRSGS